MLKSKTVRKVCGVVCMLIVVISIFTIMSSATSQIYYTSLQIHQTFTSQTREFLYPDVGYIYRNCYCANNNAEMTIEIYKDGFWQNTLESSLPCEGINYPYSTWFGTYAENVNSGNEDFFYKFVVSNNNGAYIIIPINDLQLRSHD